MKNVISLALSIVLTFCYFTGAFAEEMPIDRIAVTVESETAAIYESPSIESASLGTATQGFVFDAVAYADAFYKIEFYYASDEATVQTGYLLIADTVPLESATETNIAPKQETVTVYWVANGQVYHLSRNCSTLKRSSNIQSGSKAQSGKPRACKVCG